MLDRAIEVLRSFAKIDNNTSAHFLRSISHVKIQLNLVDSARCPTCGAGSKTVRHFLLHCPSYAHERWSLEKSLNKINKHLTLENLQGESEAIVPLTNYIDTTHRFTYNTQSYHKILSHHASLLALPHHPAYPPPRMPLRLSSILPAHHPIVPKISNTPHNVR